MVCTDAAARGLDLPDVTHVVQADFALSAIDFLHRVRLLTDGRPFCFLPVLWRPVLPLPAQ